MSVFRFWFRSIVHEGLLKIFLFLVVAMVTAVLAGALLLGDSMRGSLRQLSQKRLGQIDSIVRSDRLLTGVLSEEALLNSPWKNISQGIILDGAVRIPNTEKSIGVTMVGVSDLFWQTWFKSPPALLPSQWSRQEVVINFPLAQAIELPDTSFSAESPLLLNLLFSPPTVIPTDTVFGKKQDNQIRRSVTVREVLPTDDGPGFFSLENNQITPRLIFVPLEEMQRYLADSSPKKETQLNKNNSLEVIGKYNTLFLLNDQSSPAVDWEQADQFFRRGHFFPLGDLGIKTTEQDKTIEQDNVTEQAHATPECAWHFLYLNAGGFFFSPLLEEATLNELKKSPLPESAFFFATSSYLANSIQRVLPVDSETTTHRTVIRPAVPYSVITALDLNNPNLVQLLEHQGNHLSYPLKEDVILVNQFLADELGLIIGDTISLTYFEPESRFTENEEKSVTLTVAGILSATEGWDHHLVPEVSGLTDAETLDQWDPPFPFDLKKITSADEDYWAKHRAAPKAFLQIETAKKLWGNRFGFVSTYCIVAPKQQASDLLNNLKQSLVTNIPLSTSGLGIFPLKKAAEKASTGSTPFDVLFLSFSLFIIVSILLLLAVLVRLSFDRKHREVGILMTLGFSRWKIFGILLANVMLPVVLGGIAGLMPAVLYAQMMIHGLSTRWIGAIGVPFIEYHGRTVSLLGGATAAIAISFLVAASVFRQLKYATPYSFLRGNVSKVGPKTSRNFVLFLNQRYLPPIGGIRGILAVLLFLVGLSLALMGAKTIDIQAKTGLFFASGGTLLFALLLTFYLLLITRKRFNGHQHFSLIPLVFRLLARFPGRTVLTTSLLASSLFLVLAVGVFRLDSADDTAIDLTVNSKGKPCQNRPDGGFQLVTETRIPFYHSFETLTDFEQVFIGPGEAARVHSIGASFYPLRTRPGQKVGCSNLYRVQNNLRLIGLSRSLMDRDGFRWAAHLTQSEQLPSNPFHLLDRQFPSQINTQGESVPVIPIILDQNTAMYSLGIYQLGGRLSLQNDSGTMFEGVVVAFLSQSIFQSEVLMSEENLLRYFPEVHGYRLLLVDFTSSGSKETEVGQHAEILMTLLDRNLQEYGPTIETTSSMLTRFYSVQNGYIMIFQSLGMLGVLLGTLGLAGLQIRNTLERRRELALLSALGFSRQRVIGLLFVEGVLLLGIATIIASVTATIAVIPQIQLDETRTIHSWGAFQQLMISLVPVIVAMFLVGLLASATGLQVVTKQGVVDSLKQEES